MAYLQVNPSIGGLAQSPASGAESGGPFVNNAQIVFGEGIFGQTSQSTSQGQSQFPSASADASQGATPAVSNPYAPNASLTPSATGSATSSLLLYGALGVIVLLGVWYFYKK